MVKLSKRLQAIAHMVSPCEAVTDVGCDHAYLAIYLLEQGIVEQAVGSDLREGPLKMAADNRSRAMLNDRLKLMKYDGVPSDPPKGALVIAGMGGMLMASILRNASDRLSAFSQIICEPQSDLDALRSELLTQGFLISDEDMVFEDGKYYAVIKAVPGKSKALSKKELLYGPCLIEKKHPVLEMYLKGQLSLREKLIEKLSLSDSQNSFSKCSVVKQEKEIIEEVLADYAHSRINRTY